MSIVLFLCVYIYAYYLILYFISNVSHVHAIYVFRCDEKTLEDSLCKRVIVTRGESITKNLDPEAAAVNRDALAKIVYSRLFDWYVPCPGYSN